MRFHYCLYVIFLILFTNLGLAQEVPKGSEIVELATQPDVSPDGKFLLLFGMETYGQLILMEAKLGV